MSPETNTVLTQRADLSIEQCSCCDTISLLYQNLLLKFSPKSFLKFSSSFRELDFHKRALIFADGKEKLVVNTNQKEIQLCFEKEEFEMVCHALKEAAVMLEVKDILNTES